MTISSEKKRGVGVVVGRFQVHELHAGHLALLNRANQHQRMLVCIGVHPFLLTPTDPLDFPTRAKMIQNSFPEAIVVAVSDQRSDVVWSKNLDQTIRTYCPLEKPTLYCGRDSFKSHYHGSFDVHEIDEVHVESGTSIREQISKSVLGTKEFRAGVVYGAYNKFPVVSPTVDIAVIRHKHEDKPSILLGQKHNEPNVWRLPGGFVDMSDLTLEDAAKRELEEETSLYVDSLEYVCSKKVKDWRCGPKNSIITTLFLTRDPIGAFKAGDDLANIKMFGLHEIPWGALTESHKDLVDAAIEHYHGGMDTGE